MKNIIKILPFFLVIGCVKDYKSNTQTFLNNTTFHKIQIIPYDNGIVDSSDYKLINPNQNLSVLYMNVYGKTLSPDFGTMLQFYDSVVVSFDDTFKITHLKFDSTVNSNHSVLYSNDRCILNTKNYTQTITKETKHYMVGYYTYSFTEQDYINSQ